MSVTLASLTEKIANPAILPEERLSLIEKLDEVDIVELERRFLLISRALNTLLARAKEGEETEQKIFKAFLRAVGLASERSDVVAEKFTRYVMNVLVRDGTLSRDIIIALIRSARWALRRNPWLVFDFLKHVKKLLQENPEDRELILVTLDFVGEVSWEVPYVIHDLGENLRVWLFSEDEELRKATILALSKAGKRSFYAVHSIIEEVVERYGESISDPDILELLTTTPIPLEYKALAEKIMGLIEDALLGALASDEDRKLGLLAMANLVRRAELKELQEDFLQRLTSTLSIETNPDVIIAAIEASTIPSWHIEIDLSELVRTLTDILTNPGERDDVRLAAAQALMKLSALRYEFADKFGNALATAYTTPFEAEAKQKILEITEMVLRILKTKEVARMLIDRLIEIVSNMAELPFVRIRASRILVNAARKYYDILADEMPRLLALFRQIGEWELRDDLIRIAGMVLRRIDVFEPNAASIIIEGLSDEWVYQVALEQFNMMAFKYPRETAGYLDYLEGFLDVLESLEAEFLAEQKIEDYYAYVETPKRAFIKALHNIAMEVPEAVQKVLEIYGRILQKEKNEVILRDIATVTSQIIEKYPEAADFLKALEIPANTREILSRYGLKI